VLTYLLIIVYLVTHCAENHHIPKMQLSLLPLVCLFTSSVLAAPVSETAADLRDINLATSHVTDALRRLDAAFNSINARDDAGKVINELLNIEKFIESEILTGVGVVKRAPNVGAVEALQLITSITTITDLVAKTSDGWYDARNVVKRAGKRDAVYRQLKAASDASTQFSDALISKLPVLYQPAAILAKNRNSNLIKGALEEYGG
jgi:hypothetical protein